MDNKYYEPDISEFYVGFEYEQQEPGLLARSTSEWKKMVFELTESSWKIYRYSNLSTIRVKYLDKEDIESLGFKFTGNGESYSDELNSWHFDYVFTKKGFFDIKLQYINWRANDNEYSMVLIKKDDTFVYRGVIKNKSELIKLLSQLKVD
jgi:hypothetical protein